MDKCSVIELPGCAGGVVEETAAEQLHMGVAAAADDVVGYTESRCDTPI